jgi:hypothetical protein
VCPQAPCVCHVPPPLFFHQCSRRPWSAALQQHQVSCKRWHPALADLSSAHPATASSNRASAVCSSNSYKTGASKWLCCITGRARKQLCKGCASRSAAGSTGWRSGTAAVQCSCVSAQRIRGRIQHSCSLSGQCAHSWHSQSSSSRPCGTCFAVSHVRTACTWASNDDRGMMCACCSGLAVGGLAMRWLWQASLPFVCSCLLQQQGPGAGAALCYEQ